MGDMSEVRQLSLHPLAIHTFIKAQAGSLGKALSEAVMNSIDAFARNIEITLTDINYSIVDDGQGFRNRDEISAWFETLGFPHDEGNHRVFGKFGMGRAQQWAYAHTVWRSNQFTMKVDVKQRGINYELLESPDKFKGTRIDGTFYNPLSFQQREIVETELANLIRYAPALVTINGKVVTKDPSVEDWEKETPEAWMRFDKKASTLDVYNGGVLVAHFPRYRFKCAGVIVTKPECTLALNLARNDILEAECSIWPKIAKHFPKDSITYGRNSDEATAKKPAKPTQAELAVIAGQVKAGEMKLDKALEKAPNLIISVLGRSVKFYDMVGGWREKTVVVTPKGNEFGKRLSKLKRATVIAKESLDLFGFQSVAELKALVRVTVAAEDHAYASRYLESLDKAVWSDEPEAHFSDLAEGKVVFAQSELSKEESAVKCAWAKAWARLHYDLSDNISGSAVNDELKKCCSLMLGDSPTNFVWISEANELVLRKQEVMKVMSQSLPHISAYLVRVISTLLGQLSESPEQANAFTVEALSAPMVLGRALLQLMRTYVQECRVNDLPLPKTKLDELDTLAVE